MVARKIDHAANIAKFSPHMDVKAVNEIVKYCGVALRSRDGRYVAARDEAERARIAKGFCAKRLGLLAGEADAAVNAVAQKMKGTRMKDRVTFYYLVAEHTGRLAKLSGAQDARPEPVAAFESAPSRERSVVALPKPVDPAVARTEPRSAPKHEPQPGFFARLRAWFSGAESVSGKPRAM
jgi:Protein of unknown function (DUF2853)